MLVSPLRKMQYEDVNNAQRLSQDPTFASDRFEENLCAFDPLTRKREEFLCE
jgi:hypothetical protein